MTESQSSRRHIAHFIYRLGTGGLENGLVNLINRMPAGRYRHTIICLTHATGFKARLNRSDVLIYELNETHGMGLRVYHKLWNLLRELRPDILHTRNIPTLEGQICAFVAGIHGRVHGEHGRDVQSVNRMPFRYKVWRTMVHPFVTAYTAVSNYGATAITDVHSSVPVTTIYNGVDTDRFRPAVGAPNRCLTPFSADHVVIGTVSRLEPIKDPVLLVKSFDQALGRRPEARSRLRLAIIGDGRLHSDIKALVNMLKLDDLVWMAGDRADIPELLRALDIFVLSSRTEGLSNTLLEAMATGLPVIASEVGGNPELIDSKCGILVPPANADMLANAILTYVDAPHIAEAYGRSARARVEERFSLDSMVEQYMHLYDAVAF